MDSSKLSSQTTKESTLSSSSIPLISHLSALLKSAISRKRESLADATAVAFTRNPSGLRSALEVLAQDSTVVKQRSNAVAHIWIESPLDGKSVSQMFASHPPIQQRIETLRKMEGTPLN